jgi:hypothetical protein
MSIRASQRRPMLDRRQAWPALAGLFAGLALVAVWTGSASSQVPDAPARQVTLFGVIATPNDPRIDPKLSKVEAQLRKLLPNHGFRLLDVKTKRLTAGQTLACDLGAGAGGFQAATTLIQPIDENGKVQLRCAVLLNQNVQLESLVTTPPNQLFFCDKMLPDGTRLLIGIGAR